MLTKPKSARNCQPSRARIGAFRPPIPHHCLSVTLRALRGESAGLPASTPYSLFLLPPHACVLISDPRGESSAPRELHGTVMEQCSRKKPAFSGPRAETLFHRFQDFVFVRPVNPTPSSSAACRHQPANRPPTPELALRTQLLKTLAFSAFFLTTIPRFSSCPHVSRLVRRPSSQYWQKHAHPVMLQV